MRDTSGMNYSVAAFDRESSAEVYRKNQRDISKKSRSLLVHMTQSSFLFMTVDLFTAMDMTQESANENQYF
jgi:hypothetical protein